LAKDDVLGIGGIFAKSAPKGHKRHIVNRKKHTVRYIQFYIAAKTLDTHRESLGVKHNVQIYLTKRLCHIFDAYAPSGRLLSSWC
ncbi:MAG: hypothetical protein IK013_08990, partial [Bacteroidales bacterium]|nr:hypothetical protein [Bacteroidales bacterium]